MVPKDHCLEQQVQDGPQSHAYWKITQISYFVETQCFVERLPSHEKVKWSYVLPLHIKNFCLRDRGRLGNRGRPIWFKFGTLSYYGDLCNMPKFQLHCSYLGWVLDGTLLGVTQCFFYSPFWALFNTLITISGIF